MRIVHLAAEFAPIAKAGGLGEVILGLSRMLTRKAHDVDIIIPKYDFIDISELPNLHMEVPNFECNTHKNSMLSCKLEECTLHLLDSHHPAKFFNRDKIYGYEDDTPRFIYFAKAALEYLLKKNQEIDILHLHDWHVSLAAPMIRDLFKDLKVKKIVLSIHNLEHQGKCAVWDLDAIGMDGSHYLTKDLMQDDDLKFPESINLLKGGIVYADAIVPVSPTYAKEILTPEFGFGLDRTLRKHRTKIHGILNGIDTTIWNPAKDLHLDFPYEIESVSKAKKHYKREFNLSTEKRPWVGAVSRLVPQKGTKLIKEALKKTVELGGTFILLGSSPLPEIQLRFDTLKEEYKDNPQVYLNYTYDEGIAHRIYAALDMLIVPSKFEPCGLTQLIAMRYGTVPIVRATGGLKDTVFDCDNYKVPIKKRNGFLFSAFDVKAMNETLERAFTLFKENPAGFQMLLRKGMESDFSWKKPAEEYLKLYRSLLKSAPNMHPIRVNVVSDGDECIKSCG